MKLTPQNIQFIDNYLKNSEVIYYDIRMEMLDHVATAVEQKMEAENLDFYDAFKNYMVLNKRDLIKENEKTLKHNYKVIIPFLKFNLKLYSLLLYFSLIGLFYFIHNDFEAKTIAKFLVFSVFLGMGLFYFIQALTYYFKEKKRFYYLEKNSVILFVLYQPLLFLNNGYLTGNKNNINITVLIFLLLFFGLFLNFVRYHFIKQKQLFKSNLYEIQ
ncbi:hypothetical protein [Flavobacterium okayamense]|uniref:Uncharacterized protein n=1 Tax=Flavobacterium okayamense TaxID=2830782 RepID=A0ABM7S913_9FLAO|nr:hypothetical protein [Flavobacterium okayamense]BCY27857.1 hypothetical protein KK2020170_07250 [Flavobacterium okayamense]